MRWRSLLSVAIALAGCTLTACDGRTGSPAASSASAAAATPNPSASTDATTAAYRHVLEQGYEPFRSLYTSDPCLTGEPFKDSCRQWTLMHEALVNQLVMLLSNARVPPADAIDDQLLRQRLHVLVADDTAAANAIVASNEAAASSALGKLQTDNCTAVVPIVVLLDPNIPRFWLQEGCAK